MKRKGKRIIAFLLTFILIFGWMPTVGWIAPENNKLSSVQAAEADSGTWGTCSWNLDTDGTLTIGGGTGEALKYSSQYAGRSYVSPWCAHVEEIQKIVVGTQGEGGAVVLPESTEQLFKYYPELTTIEFVNVDTSGTDNMESMFEGCEKLTTIVGLNQFDTKKVYNMVKVFADCSALVEVDISSFDTSSLSSYSYIRSFFKNNTALKKITFGDNFSFQGENADVCLAENTKWYKEGEEDTLVSYNKFCELEATGDIVLSGTWICSDKMYWGDCEWTVEENILKIGAGCGEDNQGWDSPWSDYADVIEYIEFADGVVLPEDCSYLFFRLNKLKEIDFSNTDMSQVKDCLYLLGYCESLKKASFNAKVPGQPEDLTQLVAYSEELEQVTIGNLDTSKVDAFGNMFDGCYKLKDVDLENISIASATSLNSMFDSCKSLNTIDLSTWSSDNIMDISWMFAGCSGLTTIIFPESGIKAGASRYGAYGTIGTFSGCVSLQNIVNLDKLDTSETTDMDHMFFGCSSLTKLDLSNFNTQKVEEIYEMFSGCSSLTELDLSSFDTTNIPLAGTINGKFQYSMTGMFDGCESLAKVTVGSNFIIQGGNTDTVNGVTVEAAGSLPANHVNEDHINEWYILQSDVEGEAGKWLPIYSDTAGVENIADLNGANRVFTKTEDGTLPPQKERINLADLEIYSNIAAEYEYTGSQIRPEEGTTVLKAVINGQEVTLREGIDYEVEYPEKTSYGYTYGIGTHQFVLFNGIGDYCGRYTAIYYIYQGEKKSISSLVTWPENMTFTYTGEEIKPVPVVKDGDKVLQEGVDYRLEYENNINVANIYNTYAPIVTVVGIGNYVSDTWHKFTINAKSLMEESITAYFAQGKYAYTGDEVEPTDLIIKDGTRSLVNGKDYEIYYYQDNVEKGNEACAVIWGEGNYNSAIRVYFSIVDSSEIEESTTAGSSEITTSDKEQTTSSNGQTTKKEATTASFKKPGRVSVKKAVKKKSSKKLSLTIKKVTGASGYQVAVYGTSKNAKKNKKALIRKTIKKVKTNITANKLKNKKKLYVKVRAYKKLNGKPVYGSWSKVKKVKINK